MESDMTAYIYAANVVCLESHLAVGTDGTAKTLTQTADDYIVLPPAEYPLIPGYFRLGVASATAAARTYTVFGRDV